MKSAHSLQKSKCNCKQQTGDEWYWNKEKKECEKAKSYQEHCDDSLMCKILTEGTICESEYCACRSSQYFNISNTKCEDKVDITQKCNRTDCKFIIKIS